jgi:thymidylate kinase
VKKKPLFICFCGIDGSGKTTYSRQILEDFLIEGQPAKYVWLNSKPILLGPIRKLVRSTVLRGVDPKRDYVAYHEKRQRSAQGARMARKCYYAIMIVDYLLWVYWNLLPYLFRKTNIVCDRYIYDLAINLGDVLGYSQEEEVKFIRRLQWLLPQASLVIVCDVDEETAFRRKTDTPHLSYLVAHRSRYRYIADKFQFPVIDSSRPIETVKAEIRALVAKHVANEHCV